MKRRFSRLMIGLVLLGGILPFLGLNCGSGDAGPIPGAVILQG